MPDEIERRRGMEAVAQTLHAAYTESEIRQMAQEEARNVLGAIGFDVSDFKAQAETAAEIGRWRETYKTLNSVVKKVLMSVVGALGAAVGGAILFLLGRKS